MATELEKYDRKLIERMHEFIAEVLPDGTFRYVNRIFAEDSGYTPEALVGTNFFSYIHPDDYPETLRHCENLINKGMSIRNCEYRFKKKDASYIQIITNGEPLIDSEGKLEVILQVSFNITKQKQAEEDLRESEERYRTLFECASEGFLLMKESFIDCNEQVCTLWGCSREDVIGHTPLDFSPVMQPDGRPSAEAAKERISATMAGKPQVFYWQHVRKDGSPIDMEVSLSRIFFGGGYVLQGSIRDITERMRVEAALYESEKRFRTIFDHSNDAIFVIDPEQDEILEVSPKACDMLGFTKEELLSRRISEIHPDEVFEMKAFVQSVFEEGTGYTDKLTCRTKEGQILSASLSASKINFYEKTCILIMTRDITARKQAEKITQKYSEKLEEDVRKRTEELEGKNKELQRFNKLFVGRELRIKELKEKVKELERKIE